MCALLMLIERIKKTTIPDEIIQLYLRNTAFINSRDLVDLSAPIIVGGYYFDKDRSILYTLAKSDLLRDKRIAIISTFYFIKHRQYEDTFNLAELLLHEKEDLLQKAV
jgi:3-methyladenine DNA glycosylase AlkD